MDRLALRKDLVDHVIPWSFRMFYRHGDERAQVYFIEETYGFSWVATASDPELAKEYLIDYLIKNNMHTVRIFVPKLWNRQVSEAECRYLLRKNIKVHAFGKYVKLG